MKFGLFLDYARKAGFDGIATGHYVQKKTTATGAAALHEGIDANKDQSYFLALLNQQQIQGAHFPIGSYTKPENRAIARKYQLPNAHKKDTQGICFLGNLNINQFLQHYIEDLPEISWITQVKSWDSIAAYIVIRLARPVLGFPQTLITSFMSSMASTLRRIN